jgi:hypothetical protein
LWSSSWGLREREKSTGISIEATKNGISIERKNP